MAKFKVGDEVRLIADCSNLQKGFKGTVFESEGSLWVGTKVNFRCSCEENWELVEDSKMFVSPIDWASLINSTYSSILAQDYSTEPKTNKTLMSSISSFVKKITRSEPEKTFVQVGFLDENENITSKGEEALQYVTWEANKEALKTLADQMIAEEEANKK